MPTSSDQYINFRDLCERCKFAVKIASPLTFLKCSFVARLSKESFGFQPVLLEKRDENFSNWLAFVATQTIWLNDMQTLLLASRRRFFSNCHMNKGRVFIDDALGSCICAPVNNQFKPLFLFKCGVVKTCIHNGPKRPLIIISVFCHASLHTRNKDH